MKVEIWSDIVCPFCYIGQTKFEAALQSFAGKQDVEIEWKSFQLMPEQETTPDKSIEQVLAEQKGLSVEQARQMTAQATQLAKQAGLDYHFDKVVVANTSRAHQMLHFAKAAGKQNEAETVLFQAYFTLGKNVDDIPTLLALGQSIGLDTQALETALIKETYAADVAADIAEAQQLGVRGVPFFVFDRKYAISGAQDTRSFSEVLTKSFDGWKARQSAAGIEVANGAACTPDQDCQ